PPRVTGINLVGLRRNGFTRERIKIIKEAYKILYRSGLNLSNAVEKLKNELPMNEDIKYILEFMNNSRRGILLKAGENG
ncbi:MAG TPA: acyl-[acyl-carrier-protein]--UDP-N-acetylglucosamine O-acyltransferase, partial [candidate division WOR-3 bacterium]|nr:acyl-[acyl-carrier-protein]--UDP-N-acetylglucosamine O-acyltransferase [candidate division WOR-3 bacterium]